MMYFLKKKWKALLAAAAALLVMACQHPQIRRPTVLFDQGHGQRFLIERNETLDLARFAGLFADQGLSVRSTNQKLTPEVLAGTKVLIISGPFGVFSPEEIETILGFVEDGGRLSVMLHIGPSVADLLKRLGVAFSNGVIKEQVNLIADQPLDFYVSDLSSHPLTKDLEHFSVHGAWALINITEDGQVLARTSPHAWIDLNMDGKISKGDVMQSLGVMVAGTRGKGRFVVFGDDAIFQNRFFTDENIRLAENLIKWLGE